MFITIEGPEGSGKSSVTKEVVKDSKVKDLMLSLPVNLVALLLQSKLEK